MMYLFDLYGVIVFALMGALVARDRGLDIFGFVVMSLVTALGGGTLRDVLLGETPVFWMRDNTYVVLVAGVSLASFALLHRVTVPRDTLLLADALGLAIFAVLGTQTALEHAVSPLTAIMMGTMTGVAGGIIRDLLADRVPMVMKRDIYATAAVFGSGIFVGFDALELNETLSVTLAITLCFLLRMAAIHYRWTLPHYITPSRF
jgi:uncharacterized membrane protein YeiH